MARYRFVVEYFGPAFHGWQIQKNGKSVSGELERAFEICLRQKIRIHGAGRTDAGVHARGQVVHFDFEQSLDCYRVQESMNALTGSDIQISKLQNCNATFHARYSAHARYYVYTISRSNSTRSKNISWFIPYSLNETLLQTELQSVLGYHDFCKFSVSRDDDKSTCCVVQKAKLESYNSSLRIHLQADRFLHKMVRSIVGACVEVARGGAEVGLIRRNLGDVNKEWPKKENWIWAEPQGLSLEKVIYTDYEY